MWLKSKSIPKVYSSILKVFEPKFSIFSKQQYPSFSTSLQRNVATWGLWYANIFVDFFSCINDQHLETFCFCLKSEYVSLVFFRHVTFKTVCCYSSSSFFFDLISNALSFFSSEHCERTKKLAVQPLRLKRNQISVLKCCMTKKMPISFFHCFVANFLDNIAVLDTHAFQTFSRDIFYFSTTFFSEYHSKPANETSRNRN